MKLTPAAHVSLALHHMQMADLEQLRQDFESEANEPTESLIPPDPIAAHRNAMNIAKGFIESRIAILDGSAQRVEAGYVDQDRAA